MRRFVEMRRLATATVLAVAMLALGVLPAGATPPPPPPQTLTAIAFWDLDDANNNAVSLQVTRTPDQKSLFVFITQQFCDTATDERVFHSFSAQVPVSGVARINEQLRHAILATKVTGNETEQRQPNCASPSGQPTFVNLGPTTVGILAGWLGTGPITPVQPGIESRAANANGFIAGPGTLAIGTLGPSANAELRRTTP